MKGQGSAEFLVIVGVLTFVMVPILLLIYINANASPEKIALGKATFSAARLASAADSVGAMGLGAQVFTTIDLSDVDSISVAPYEVAITTRTSYGNVTVVSPSKYSLKGMGLSNIKSAGTYTFIVSGPDRYGSNGNVTIALR